MNFSCMIWPFSGATVEPVVRLAQTAEQCGFESVYVGDSQMIWNDVWVTLAACAVATERVKLGTGVTNTVTRHPAVTANAAMTLNMLSNGRAKLGLGAGDSAVRTAGLSPARLPQLRERLTFMRALLDGKEVDALRPPEEAAKETWGRVDRVRLVGADKWGKFPVQFACMGPKSVEMAGELCDGVIVDGHMGGNAEGVRATVVAAAEGARVAGKDPKTLRFIAAIDAAIDADRTKALDKVRPTAARNIARKPWLPDTLGIEHADVVKAVQRILQVLRAPRPDREAPPADSRCGRHEMLHRRHAAGLHRQGQGTQGGGDNRNLDFHHVPGRGGVAQRAAALRQGSDSVRLAALASSGR